MVSTSFVTLVFLVCLQTVFLSTVSNCAKTISMYWNTTNSIFRIDNTDHIIDVNKNNAAFEYDQVNIICPVYQGDTYDEEAEKYIIYNVSKEEYETCRITNPTPRVIAICDKPSKTMYFTITFRPFTPQPGGLEFHPGRDYYFISTSSKDDLHRRIGGRCTTHNMKVVFKVCCNENEAPNSAVARNNSTSTSSTASSPNNPNTSLNSNVNINGPSDNSILNSINNINSANGPNNGNSISSSGNAVGNPNLNNNNNGNNNNNNNNNNNGMSQGGSNNGNILSGHPAPIPPSIFKGAERYYPGNIAGGSHYPSSNDHHENRAPTDLAPTHIPALPPLFPNYPHHQSPQPPAIYPGSPPMSTSSKSSNNHKKNKNKEYSDHPNEVVKNEELTYNSASSLHRSSRSQTELIVAWSLLLLCSLHFILPQHHRIFLVGSPEQRIARTIVSR